MWQYLRPSVDLTRRRLSSDHEEYSCGGGRSPKLRLSVVHSHNARPLADRDRIADEVAREWRQVRLRERMDWLYNYDATAIAI